ncbi:Putative RNA polymerase sigma factor (ECF family) [Janibacter sp. HTCC2649]|uniref:RNA polymerase sigma factor n=1 Tax=Janibacter sp. HTCC2649 TaxID=313589 RepID=UPI0000671919|nr:sigma-70 family RNA polymerase sigma factor [Janibacter sp. HTCC2649]EAP98487.1 Putative RNA polymerase sigma factor (ECF family) [Janibacter sp. HTCC2649]
MDTPAAREQRFRALYADHYDHVLRFVARRSSPASAEDVVAEAFLVAWRRLDDVPTRVGEALPWLYAVARNCLLNSARAAGRQGALAVRIGDAGPSHAHLDTDHIARRVDLATAWQRLTDAEQEVLALAIWEDLPSPAAARVLGTTAAAYRLRLSRARRALRRHLDPTDTPVPARPAPALLKENS